MHIKTILGALALTASLAAGCSAAPEPSAGGPADDRALQVQQIRNATVKVSYGDMTFLIDPMLAAKGAYPGFQGTLHSELRNPLVELPMPVQAVIEDVDVVIVTHTHLDHWDDAARNVLPKDIPLLTQNQADARLIRSQGFSNVRILEDQTEINGVRLHRTGGQHGSDAIYATPVLGERLGSVMGVVFEVPGQKTVYVAGDTVWRPEVDDALARFRPDVIVLNAGAGVISGFENDPITMGKEDMLRASRAAPDATIVAIHMDAINHMTLSRTELAGYVRQQGISERVLIPADGEILRD